MNSREKGKRGERQWRDVLRAHGYAARRGQQFAGSPDSPDVICDELDWAHFEVKFAERFNAYDAMEQAHRDCGLRTAECGSTSPQPLSDRAGLASGGEGVSTAKVPFVIHRRSFRPFLVVMDEETFFRLLRGELPPQPKLDSLAPAHSAPAGPLPAANSFRRFPSDSNLRGEQPRDGTGAVRQELNKQPK